MTRYVLLAAQGNGVGKSYTANLLKKELEELGYKVMIRSFADGVREHLHNVFEALSVGAINPFSKEHRDLYNAQKNGPYTYDTSYPPIHLRELLCDYSDVIKKHFGLQVWGRQLLLSTCDPKIDFVIVDDFRTTDEFKALSDNNTYTIYLKKEGYQLDLGASGRYERQLQDFVFDLTIEFKEDYSNTNENIQHILKGLLQ